jgi:hypothetical protein
MPTYAKQLQKTYRLISIKTPLSFHQNTYLFKQDYNE